MDVVPIVDNFVDDVNDYQEVPDTGKDIVSGFEPVMGLDNDIKKNSNGNIEDYKKV